MSDEIAARGRAIRQDMFGSPGDPSPGEFRGPLEDLVTRYCFGETWGRDLLPRKTRSMLTLAILAGQAKPNQLRVHVKGAIANGVSVEEIREVLLHAAIYCGIPSAADAFQQAEAALKEIGAL